MRRRIFGRLHATYRQSTHQQRLLSSATRRNVQISAVPSSTEPIQNIGASSSDGNASPIADARFEVLGSPSSLLSASISASQNLYTRRGTLVGFSGEPENALSTLSLLGPILRAPLGVPFLYQRITSTTPYTALIGSKSPVTSMTIVHLDGRLDWMVAQRNALLAWTGHTLSLSPRLNLKMPLAHWGNTSLTGRGLVALAGKGQIHQVHLRAGEEYIVHPSNVVAYSITQYTPQPYRFKTNGLRLQIPNVSTWLPETRFWSEMRKTTVWQWTASAYFTLRTWTRRTIWGDRLFLHFKGPVNILLQSRASSINEVLTSRDVNEIADAPAGAVSQVLTQAQTTNGSNSTAQPARPQAPTSVSFAQVSRDGKVKFDEQKSPESS